MDVLNELGDLSLVLSLLKVLLNYMSSLNYSSNVISHTTPLVDFLLREGVKVTYENEPYVIEAVNRATLSISLKSLKNERTIVVPFYSGKLDVNDINLAYDTWLKNLRVGDAVDLKLKYSSKEEWVPALYKGREKMQQDYDYVFSYYDLCERKASFHELSASLVYAVSSWYLFLFSFIAGPLSPYPRRTCLPFASSFQNTMPAPRTTL